MSRLRWGSVSQAMVVLITVNILWSIAGGVAYAAWPISGSNSGPMESDIISSDYGPRYASTKFHYGIDFAVNTGQRWGSTAVGVRSLLLTLGIARFNMANGKAFADRVRRRYLSHYDKGEREKACLQGRGGPHPLPRCPKWRRGEIQLVVPCLLPHEQPLSSCYRDPRRQSFEGHEAT